jgi:hypothetical protein
MRQVQALARQALGDTREIVSGYRRVALNTEIGNATRVLAAAGVDCRMARAPELPALSAPVEHLLGLVVREGTTNVIRHSAATRAGITLAAEAGGVRLRFTNDAPLPDVSGPAGGLAGLAARFADVGGQVGWRRAPDQFAVDAFLPAAAIAAARPDSRMAAVPEPAATPGPAEPGPGPAEPGPDPAQPGPDPAEPGPVEPGGRRGGPGQAGASR